MLSWRFRVPLRDLAYLRFLLEAYEGLGIQTSNAGSNLVTWHLPPSRIKEAEALLASLAEEIPLHMLPPQETGEK